MNTEPQAEPQRRPKRRTRLWFALAVVVGLIALFVIPPLVSINRYHNRIAELISASLRRPARLSSVELRLLPRPGFVLTNLVVDEDPAYGAEPVLHAATVVASIRFLPLWRGQIEISRISVDDASLNLVRATSGQWNLNSLFNTAAATTGDTGNGHVVPLPYMEATNSRINVKNGAEKLPFSLLDADASLWQEAGGTWRVRLRGQPARTDISLDLPDTGIVRLEATLGRAAALSQMPLHLDMDWRDAQLGQLSRLVLGSDEGWRGDMTGELHLNGTLEAAEIKSRLRAAGVHRAEFAPAAPMDFDASCNLVYHFADRRLENLVCDSPIGSGRARITSVARNGAVPLRLSLELDKIPAQVGLDALRTLRNNLDPSLQAAGSVSGRMTFDTALAQFPTAVGRNAVPSESPGASQLMGSFTVDGLQITGEALGKPLQVEQIVFKPVPEKAGQTASLSTVVDVPAGAPTPLTITGVVARTGFQVAVHGLAALPRLRELAHMAGVPAAAYLTQIAGAPAQVDLDIEGPWLPSTPVAVGAGTAMLPALTAYPRSDRMEGTVALHDATWKADFLANPLRLPAAVLHVENGDLRWDGVEFTYGAVKGTGTLTWPSPCASPQACTPRFTVQFGSLDAAALQASILGAHEPGTLLSSLIDRLRPSNNPPWPAAEGSFQAEALDLGPFTFSNVSAAVRILPDGAEITSLNGALLGGQIRTTGALTTANKPAYKLEGSFTQLKPDLVGQLFGMRWSGGAISGNGAISFSGFTDKDISASAQGTLHFDWRRGTMASLTEVPIPHELARFDRWTGDAAIGGSLLTLGENNVQRDKKKTVVHATASFGIPSKVSFEPAAGSLPDGP